MESRTTDIDQDTLPEPMPATGTSNSNFAPPDPPQDDAEVPYTGEHENFEHPEPGPQQAETEKSPEDEIETLLPHKEPRTWKLGKDEFEREYVQRPLSFVAKMEWFAEVGKVLDQAMSGDDALTVSNLMSGPGVRGSNLTMSDFRDADTFIQAIGKLVSKAPNFIMNSYCIWLGIPDYEREMAIMLMSRPEEEGGLSDEDGIGIMETFVDQNFEALDRFFRQDVQRFSQRIQKRVEEAQASPSSKR